MLVVNTPKGGHRTKQIKKANDVCDLYLGKREGVREAKKVSERLKMLQAGKPGHIPPATRWAETSPTDNGPLEDTYLRHARVVARTADLKTALMVPLVLSPSVTLCVQLREAGYTDQ